MIFQFQVRSEYGGAKEAEMSSTCLWFLARCRTIEWGGICSH